MKTGIQKNIKKFYPILLILVLVLLAVAAVYWRNQSQPALPPEQQVSDVQNQAVQPQFIYDERSRNDTSMWKIYTRNNNSGINYQLSYPQLWEVKDTSNDTQLILQTTNARIEITTPPLGFGFPMDKSSSITIGNRAAKRYLAPGQALIKFDDKSLENIQIFYTSDQKFESKNVPEIEQILSTFKFLDAAPVSTADWRIFDQEKYGVRADVLLNFKFPAAWYAFNVSGGPFTEVNFSDGGNLVKQNLGDQTIENKLYELNKPQENECRLSIGVSAEDGGYAKVDRVTEHNSKVDSSSRNLCTMILSILRKQMQIVF